MNQDSTDDFKKTINDINTEMVELHCKLNNSNLTIKELQVLQQDLNTLALKYHLLDMNFSNYMTSLNGDLTKDIEVHSNRCKYDAAFAIIPIIGIFLAVYLVLRNYNVVLESKLKAKELTILSEELLPNLKIIKGMLERKFILINNKLATLSNDTNNIVENYDTSKDIIYYDANELIINYIDSYEFNLDDIEPETKKAMVKLLQIDLKTECSDLLTLLKIAREISNNNQPKLIKKNSL